jgi:hypothetical protein
MALSKAFAIRGNSNSRPIESDLPAEPVQRLTAINGNNSAV